jgi:hypothetical protein
MNIELINYTIKYRKLLEEALDIIKININNDSHLKNICEDFLNMARNYLKDGKVLEEKKDYSRALASYSYAYGWIDAGVRIGLFYAKDRNRFTLFK